jgi:putative PIN family toxin of toxin-antitoxin system
MPVLTKCCIDSCIWIKYAGNFRINTLIKIIVENTLLVYADRYLLSEVHNALIEQFQLPPDVAFKIVKHIRLYIILTVPRNIYRLSVDPKDNFLYDICIQNNCRYLITIDKDILKDRNAPFITKTDAWLKKKK